MDHSNPREPPDGFGNELELIFDISAGMLARSSDPRRFLDWIADAGPALAPVMAAEVDPRTGPASGFFRALGVAIYDAMPLPDANFRPRPIPRPGRNDPCLCGSGLKFKRCCMSSVDKLDFSEFNLLRYALDHLPQKAFANLPRSKAEPFAVADTACQLARTGRDGTCGENCSNRGSRVTGSSLTSSIRCSTS